MANTKPRLLFWFLHLLGVGHVYRAKRLVEGFAQAGIAVDIIYGGTPVPDMAFEAESIHYLPAIRAGDPAFSHYLDENGNRLDKPFQDLRTNRLLQIFETLNPDLILTEAFPFGRRMVRHELRALIDAATARPDPPLIVSSVRDILHEGRKPGRNEETCDWINGSYDHVLVHSDPEIIDLGATFPLTGKIRNKLSYTGFVVPPAISPVSASARPALPADATTKYKEGKQDEIIDGFDVIVSAGGGAFGGDLLNTALEVANTQPNRRWCLICGPNLPSENSAVLRAGALSHVIVKSSVKNLAACISASRISVSQCGYNTAMDVLSAHRDSPCRAVFVPYDEGGQTEQLRRASLLQRAGYAISVPQSGLTAENLAAAIDRAERLPQVSHVVNFNGVENSATLVRQWIDEKR